MHTLTATFLSTSLLLAAVSCASLDPQELTSCYSYVSRGPRDVAADRTERSLGKVREETARCRGGERAVQERPRPWIDWRNYWATGDVNSKVQGFLGATGEESEAPCWIWNSNGWR